MESFNCAVRYNDRALSNNLMVSKNLFDKYIVISSNGKYVLPKLILNFGCGILQLSMNLNASK